jgi:hypothetical protein
MLWWKKGVLSPAAMQARCHDPQNALVEEGCAILRCHASSLCDPQNALVQGRVCYPALSCRSCCHDPQNALVEEGCAIPAMQARCCCDSQNALVQGRVCYPCAVMHAAAVMIHRMLWWKKGNPCLPCKLAAVVIQNALVQGRVCYPCAVMQAAAVVIHRMLW